jgi:microcystin-dependent protein
VSPSDYSDLYDVIGSTYGLTADGNFKVPNLKGFAVIGSYGASNLGDTTGHKEVTLSTIHIPSHRHIYTGTHKHGDGVNQYTNDNSFSIPRSMSGNGRSGSTHDSAVHNSQNGWHYHPDFTSGSETHKHTGYNNKGGEAHNNLMPYIVLNYIIKY